MEIKKDFYKLLCLNSKDEVEKFLIKEGKGPKAVCPIIFDIKKEKEQEKCQSQN